MGSEIVEGGKEFRLRAILAIVVKGCIMIVSRRHFLKTSGVVGLFGLVDGFKGSVTEAANQLVSPDKIVMQLDWKYNAQFAGVLLADYYNLYDKSGLEVEIRPAKPGIMVIDKVAKNPWIIGCGEQDMILNAQIAGKPIKAIATMFQNSPLGLMSMPSNHIYHLQDLRGKRVGMQGESSQIMKMVMDYNNIPSNQIEIVPISGEEKYERILGGDLDAVQCYIVDEPIGFVAKTGIKPNIIKFSDYGYDAYVQVIFAHNQLLENSPKIVDNFLQATFRGWKLALDDIQQAAEIIVNYYVEPGSEYDDLDYQVSSLVQVVDYVTAGITDSYLGKIDSDRWQSMATKFVDYDIISQVPLLSSSVDERFLVSKS